MKIEVNTHAIIKINCTYDSVEELRSVENLFLVVLSKIFLNRPALLITISPDKRYSFGYEIASFQEIKIGKAKFLVNEVQSCSSSLLTEVSQSEELGRGLLFLMKKDGDLFANLEESLNYIHNDLGRENLSYEMAVCENDGKTLSLYNTSLSEKELFPLISSFKE
ncbi:MAG: hypothetical protein J7599_13960 [Niabella sp.]|nr:hypothetical protein [Niabella sp.]